MCRIRTQFSVSSLIIALLVLVSPLQAQTKNNEAYYKEKMKQIDRQIQEKSRAIEEKKEKRSAVYRDVLQLQKSIVQTDAHLNQNRRSLMVYSQKIEDTQNHIRVLQTSYQRQSNAFGKRLAGFYKNKNLGVLELLFSKADFETIVDSSYYFDRIMKTDIDLFNELRSQYNHLNQENRVLSHQVIQIKEVQSEIRQQKYELATKKAKKEEYQRALDQEIRQYEEETEELRQSSLEITQLLERSGGVSDVVGTGRFIMPTQGWFSSPFGYRVHPIFRTRRFHAGQDIAAPMGTRIIAADSGTVIFAGTKGGYGKLTIIDHGRNMSTVYGHQSRIIVASGQAVKQGQLIGYVGSTGFSTGPHLHFEVRISGNPVDPRTYLR